jgi:hypothetical protein
MIKQGDVAYLKTTGEAVYVLVYPGGVTDVSVRRPVMGQNGIHHDVEQFTIGELETRDEVKVRMQQENDELYQRFAPSKIPDSPAAIN